MRLSDKADSLLQDEAHQQHDEREGQREQEVRVVGVLHGLVGRRGYVRPGHVRGQPQSLRPEAGDRRRTTAHRGHRAVNVQPADRTGADRAIEEMRRRYRPMPRGGDSWPLSVFLFLRLGGISRGFLVFVDFVFGVLLRVADFVVLKLKCFEISFR